METGLIFNQAFQPELMQYDADYQNEQAHSPAFRSHLNEVIGIVRRHFHDRTLIEVGCGKGYFLECLRSQGFQVTGLDPAYEGTSSNVIKSYFTSEIGLRADGIILRHVLEHVQDPIGFLRRIRDANGGRGRVYIEVPCFDWICQRRAWFDVFYEHVNYFRISDFQRSFGTVYDSGRIFGGQYLYIVADLATIRTPRLDPGDRFAFPTDFLATVSGHAERIKAYRKRMMRHTVVWGGASKGVIFALFMGRAGAGIDFVIDINPARQGKHLAATGLRVSSPEEAIPQVKPGSLVFIMNGNYVPEIRRMTLDSFDYATVDHESL